MDDEVAVTVNAKLTGVESAAKTLEELNKELERAKALVSELALSIRKLSVKVDVV